MTIYTSYFAALRKLPPEVKPVSIACLPPRFYTGEHRKYLAPTLSMLTQYQLTHDTKTYTESFNKILEKLDIDEVLKDLRAINNDGPIALICYEGPNKFCHRHLVAKWFQEHGIEVQEYPLT